MDTAELCPAFAARVLFSGADTTSIGNDDIGDDVVCVSGGLNLQGRL